MKKVAVITGADGGIGIEITRGIALAGYRIVMACRTFQKGERAMEMLIRETGNQDIEVVNLDLSSLKEVALRADEIGKRYGKIGLLMNNAGTIASSLEHTEDGFEKTVGVNYIGHYLFTCKLIPFMEPGARIVNMVSCTYPLGRIDLPHFFTSGRKGSFRRLSVYSNTKLALLLFTRELAEQLLEKGIRVNAADPGIVSTNMITMNQWFDPLADLFFRPFIRKPANGAAPALTLLLKEEQSETTGCIGVSGKVKELSASYKTHPLQKKLWEETARQLRHFMDNPCE